MKLIFICGSFELSKDGVADYIHLLSKFMISRGHFIKIVSLHDRYIPQGMIRSIVGEIEVLRISSIENWTVKTNLLKEFIDDFDPDCLSLQYVPFAYQKKGIPVSLVSCLTKCGQKRRWHVMFHELWIGMDVESGAKTKFLGWIQKMIVKSLVNRLDPIKIDTQAQLYKIKLKEAGIDAEIFPLFGNIPVIYKPVQEKLNQICFVIFGGIHFGAPLNSFLAKLMKFAEFTKMTVEFNFVGRNGSEKTEWITVINNYGFKINDFGECTPDEISKIFSISTCGISTTPYFLIDKSGSVAAMREHSLPVLCLARNWSTNASSLSQIHHEGISQYDDNFDLEKILIDKSIWGQTISRYNQLTEFETKLHNSLWQN